MKKIKICLILSLLITLFFSSIAYGGSNIDAVLPEKEYEFYVYDESNILSEDVKNYIIATNRDLYSQTGAQLVVAIVNSLEGYDINTYKNELFKKWEIGSKDEDNGVLLLIAMQDREFAIETGYGLEGALPDIKGKNILNKMTPYFKDGHYENGIIEGYNEILQIISKEYSVNLDSNPPVEERTSERSAGVFDIFVSMVIIYVTIKIFLRLINSRKFRNMNSNNNKNKRNKRNKNDDDFFPPFWGGGSSGGGFGGGFGGFGGFGGGGSSGGGGASGKW